MKNILLGMLTLSGAASAATWEKVGAIDGYYYSPATPTQLAERAMTVGEAMAGENAIVLATSFKNSASLFCNVYEYAGELQETFVFSYWEGSVTRDTGNEATFESLLDAKKNKDKASIALFSTLICDDIKREAARNIYVPSRFSELALPSNFRDTTLKLTRLYGAAIRSEIK